MPETDEITIEIEPVRGGREFGPLQPEPQQANTLTEEQLQFAAEFEQRFGLTAATVKAKQVLEAGPELANQFFQRAADRAGDDRGEDLTRSTREQTETRTVSESWLGHESTQIRQQAASSVFETAEEAALAAAYYNGRRETFNSARENFIASNPEVTERLPAAIDIQEVQVRTRAQEFETPSMEIGS